MDASIPPEFARVFHSTPPAAGPAHNLSFIGGKIIS
jgi:hypothetical protein